MFHLYWAQGQNLRKHVIKKTIQIALLSTESDPIHYVLQAKPNILNILKTSASVTRFSSYFYNSGLGKAVM